MSSRRLKMERTNYRAPHRSLRFLLRTLFLLAALAAVTVLSCGERSPGSSADRSVHSELPAPAEGGDSGAPRRPHQGASGLARHEHEPEHGGTVRSVDVYHVEVVEDPVRVWLYDRRGNPLPLEGVEGQIVIYSGDARYPHTLQVRGSQLAPIEPVTLPDEGSAFVELTIGKQSIDAAFELPLDSAGSASPDQV